MEIITKTLGVRLHIMIRIFGEKAVEHFVRFFNKKVEAGDITEEVAKKYILLFKAFAAQQVYDEAAIRDQFPEISNFSHAVRTLKETIMEWQVYRASHPRAKAMKKLISIQDLMQAGNYDESYEQVKELKEKANLYQYWGILVDLLKIRNQLLENLELYEEIREKSFKYNTELNMSIFYLGNLNHYESAYRSFHLVLKEHHIPRGEKELSLMEPLEEDKRLMDSTNAHSPSALIFYHLLQYIISLFRENYGSCLIHCQDIESILIENPLLIEDNEELYISLLNSAWPETHVF